MKICMAKDGGIMGKLFFNYFPSNLSGDFIIF